jgi:hypothetical protein
MTNVFQELGRSAACFAAEDLKLYPCLCEVLRRRNLPLQAQYTTTETALVFDCDVRVIQERIHSGKWKARDLPKRGRFLPCDLEGFLQVPLLVPGNEQKLPGGQR